MKSSDSHASLNKPTLVAPSRSRGLLILLLVGVSVAMLSEASASSRRLLRQYGYNGTYRGIVTGIQSTRPVGTAPFSRERVSKSVSFQVPPKQNEAVTPPKGEGSYRVLNRITVNGARASIRGQYFGTRLNPNIGKSGKRTTREGVRIITIRRAEPQWDIDRMRNNVILGATYLDSVVEYDVDNISAILARWTIRGSLKKR